MIQLSLGLRTIFFLYDCRREFEKDLPSDRLTQEGIAKALDIPRSHVTRIVRPLISDGLVREEKRRVKGRDRMLKVYSLTPSGFEKVEANLKELMDRELRVISGGDEFQTTVSRIMEMHERPGTLEMVSGLMEGGVLQLDRERAIISNADLDMEDFFERDEELSRAEEFLEGDALVLVIISNRGYGSSALMRKTALQMTERPLMWHDLSVDGSEEAISNTIYRFEMAIGCVCIDELKERDALICFDNYHLLPERGVDCMIEILERLRNGRVKMMVAMRGETPSYNRFYQKNDIDCGRVVEVRLGRLSPHCLESMFGSDMDEEALKLIYMLTRGQPLALNLLRKADDVGLKDLFPNEEVRFMMYLRTKKKSRDSDVE